MAKPWLERWVKNLELSGRVEAEGDLDAYVTDGYESDDRTQLISAAPDMCRALLAVEKAQCGYGGGANYDAEIRAGMFTAAKVTREKYDESYGNHFACPWCPYVFYEKTTLKGFFHHPDCPIDAALTKAGLPDQASRNAARGELGL
jgi:hypothetical protein